MKSTWNILKAKQPVIKGRPLSWGTSSNIVRGNLSTLYAKNVRYITYLHHFRSTSMETSKHCPTPPRNQRTRAWSPIFYPISLGHPRRLPRAPLSPSARPEQRGCLQVSRRIYCCPPLRHYCPFLTFSIVNRSLRVPVAFGFQPGNTSYI